MAEHLASTCVALGSMPSTRRKEGLTEEEIKGARKEEERKRKKPQRFLPRVSFYTTTEFPARL